MKADHEKMRELAKTAEIDDVSDNPTCIGR